MCVCVLTLQVLGQLIKPWPALGHVLARLFLARLLAEGFTHPGERILTDDNVKAQHMCMATLDKGSRSVSQSDSRHHSMAGTANDRITVCAKGIVSK